MAYQIKALGVGGILDQAIAVTKANFGLLFGIVAVVILPVQLVQGFLPLALAGQDLQTVAIANILMVIASAFFVFPISNAAIIYAVSERYLGRDTTFGEAVKFGTTQIGPLLWTTILLVLAISGGFILLIIPGILFGLWFGLSQEVVVLEGITGTKALGRSKTLVRPNLGTFLILSLILGVVGWLLGASVGTIPEPYTRIVAICLMQSVLTMFGLVATVIYYFSCRCKVENFDLEHLAASIGEAAPTANEPTVADE